MTFEPVLPPAILAVVAVAIVAARFISLREVVVTAGTRRRPVLWRWGVVTLAVLALLVAAARPGTGSAAPESVSAPAAGETPNVFFVVDRSADTRVDDFGDGRSRLSGIRADMATIIDRNPQARFAVISFASRPSLDWPLSDDVWSLEPVVAGLQPYPTVAPDAAFQVNAAAGANVLRYQLIQAGQQYPQSANLVYYFGSGAGGSRAPQGRFGSGSVDGGAVLGYGTDAGGPSSGFNEPALRAIADQLDVPYVHREAGQPPDTVVPQTDAAAGQSAASLGSEDSRRAELYWLFALLSAGLLLIEICLSVRDFRRNRLARQDVEL